MNIQFLRVISSFTYTNYAIFNFTHALITSSPSHRSLIERIMNDTPKFPFIAKHKCYPFFFFFYVLMYVNCKIQPQSPCSLISLPRSVLAFFAVILIFLHTLSLYGFHKLLSSSFFFLLNPKLLRNITSEIFWVWVLIFLRK